MTFVANEGKRAFKLHQDVFESVEYRDQHTGGWTQCLDRLGEYVLVMNIH